MGKGWDRVIMGCERGQNPVLPVLVEHQLVRCLEGPQWLYCHMASP